MSRRFIHHRGICSLERRRYFLASNFFVVLAGIVFFVFGFLSDHEKSSVDQNIGYLVRNPNSFDCNNCSHFYNFDVYRCGPPTSANERISVYVESPTTAMVSKEFYLMLDAISHSKYAVKEKEQACLIVPNFDILNFNYKFNNIPFNGHNILLFNMLGRNETYGESIMALADALPSKFRKNFDISIPVYNHYVQGKVPVWNPKLLHKRWLLLIFNQHLTPRIRYLYFHRGKLTLINTATNGSILFINRCKASNIDAHVLSCNKGRYSYPDVLRQAVFCLVYQTVERSTSSFLMALLYSGCIPIIVLNKASIILPFSSVIDWSRFSIFIQEDRLASVVDVINNISISRMNSLRHQGIAIYETYFSDPGKIAITTIDIVNYRVFPLTEPKASYSAWNLLSHRMKGMIPKQTALFEDTGFTAVFVTSNDWPSVVRILRFIVSSPNLVKILVIWNNPHDEPPPRHLWPNLTVPLRLAAMKDNLVSNRFYPHVEIETECVLNLDDKIMSSDVSTNELEFGYQVWREFPDRLIGLSSLFHDSDKMVRTSGVFYHQIWNHIYTDVSDAPVKAVHQWIDANNICEDIAMNFLVCNRTNKSSFTVGHLSFNTTKVENKCFENLVQAYGGKLPLKLVDFNTAPVKDSVNRLF